MTEDRARQELMRWMTAVLKQHNWTAEEWARRADTSGTNITRFMREANDFIPSLRTIMRLASVAGSVPRLDKVAPPRYVSVPILRDPDLAALIGAKSTTEASLMHLLRSATEQISVSPPADDRCFAVEISEGPQTGSLAVVRVVDEAMLKEGDAVVALARRSGRTGAFYYNGGLFIPMGEAGSGNVYGPSQATLLGKLLSLTQRF